jgi:hypothetical protein
VPGAVLATAVAGGGGVAGSGIAGAGLVYAAVGADAIVGSDVPGTALAGEVVAATEFAEGGVAAARSVSGVAVSEGNVGAVGTAGAASATTVASFAALSGFFQKAQRGPDWQPTSPATVRTTHARMKFDWFMSLPGAGPADLRCRCAERVNPAVTTASTLSNTAP